MQCLSRLDMREDIRSVQSERSIGIFARQPKCRQG